MGTNASGTTKQAWFAFDRRDWLAFDRGDYLATRVVLGITALGALLFGLGGFVVDAAGFGGLLGQFAQGVSDNMIQTTGRVPASGGLSFVFSFTPLPIAIMLVIALVGEAFRRGVVLREDTEGLV